MVDKFAQDTLPLPFPPTPVPPPVSLQAPFLLSALKAHPSSAPVLLRLPRDPLEPIFLTSSASPPDPHAPMALVMPCRA